MIAKKVVSFGEVMLRLSSPNYNKLEQSKSFDIGFGGSEMNVVAALSRYGINACHVSVFPNNTIGNMANSYLKELEIDTSEIKMKGERFGLYFYEKGASMRPSQIVYDRNYSAFQQLNPAWFDWKKILKRADWFHWSGITPSLSKNAAVACLEAVKTAQSMGIPVSADVFYRRGQWNYGKQPQDILPELVANSTILLANAQNMEDILGIKTEKTSNTFVDASKKTMQKYKSIKKVVNTNRENISSHHNKISAELFDGENLQLSKQIDIPFIVDRVGGGDAFLGGFIYAQLQKMMDLDSLDFGIAASALKHTINGDINLASLAEIENVMSGDFSGRLNR